MWRNIICRFGIPHTIITDHGAQFTSDQFRERCSEQGVRLRYSSVAHPQSNGQVEVSNRTLLKAISKKVYSHSQSWVEVLPEILWAYRTTVHSGTGETPYSLVYGCEAILPIDVTTLSSRLEGINLSQNDQRLREELNLLEDRRAKALLR